MLTRLVEVREFEEHALLERERVHTLLLDVFRRLVFHVFVGFDHITDPDNIRTVGPLRDITHGIEIVFVPPRFERLLTRIEDRVVGESGHGDDCAARIVGLRRNMKT